jgi:predicted NBD/HSP70 family sugar kinase
LHCIAEAVFYVRAMRISDHTLNRLSILKAILQNGPVARTDLPDLTGLSAGLITQQTSELVSSGLVVETREAASRKGRPRMLLEINGDDAVVIGASIDGQGNLLAAFVSLSGKKLHEARVHFPASATLADMAENIGNAIKQAIAESPIDADRIARVGIALPSVIDTARGAVHFNTTFPVEPTPFAAPIAQIIGIPVTIENNMDCMARAEHWFGCARNDEDFVLVRVGLSIDAAEFANGVPKSGSNGLNSSFGHIKTVIDKARRRCYCGGSGCLTAYASIYGILEAANCLAELPFPYVEELPHIFSGFLDQATKGEPTAIAAIELAGQHLGSAIGNYLNIANPSKIFIAVDNADFLEQMRAPFAAALAEAAMPGTLPLTTIKFSRTNEDWRWSGTAALALEQMYLDDYRNNRLNTGRFSQSGDPAQQRATPGNDNRLRTLISG